MSDQDITAEVNMAMIEYAFATADIEKPQMAGSVTMKELRAISERCERSLAWFFLPDVQTAAKLDVARETKGDIEELLLHIEELIQAYRSL